MYGLVHEEVGTRELMYNVPVKSTVSTLLRRLVEDYPGLREMTYNEEGKFREFLELAVNQTDIIVLDGLETTLEDEDLLQIMPPIGGG